jgi:hypothetical protein
LPYLVAREVGKVEIFWVARYVEKIWKKKELLRKMRTAIGIQLEVSYENNYWSQNSGKCRAVTVPSTQKGSFLVENSKGWAFNNSILII